MPSTWMGGVPPLTWRTAHWPATPRTTVSQTPCGAALGGSPPSCASTSPSVSLRTAAGTGRASMGTANARRAGVGLAVTPWCANRPPVVPTVSVHRMAVRVTLDGEGRTAAKDPMICEECALSSFGNYVCDLGFYGDGCNQTCTCTNGGSCDTVHGGCSCPIGFHGDSCEQECPLGLYGLDCGKECQCQDMCPCDPVTGSCNALFQGEKNQSIHRAGHCLANQMFAIWSEEEAHKSKPYLSEQCWLIVTGLLTSLLLASLVGHLIMCRRAAAHHPGRVDYSYVPLTEIGASSSGVRGKGSQPSRGVFEMEDSDSQDELWSGPR
uniref:N-acetylglucosamine-1-phosphodiester alpha-N-acetylglucosaminidase n=1 Tax=Salmo trutta TaxID=8032 RepID=A0A673XD14_SALTR